MRLGIHMPLKDQDGKILNAKGVMARAQAVESAGFDGVWIGDGLGGASRPDPLMWLLVAAAATERLEVGTSIYQVPLRHPVELAQRFMTLQALTEGRFSIGVGTGSSARGYEALGRGEDFERRFKLLNEDLKTIRRLCNGETVGPANVHPWPETHGGPPIIIGSWSSEVWMRRAATEYDGWMCSGSFNRSKDRGHETSMKSLRENLQRYRDMGGKRALISSCLIDLSAPEHTLADDEPFQLFCGPESASERLHRLQEIGYDDVLLVKRGSDRGVSLYEDDYTAEDLQQIRGLLKQPVAS